MKKLLLCLSFFSFIPWAGAQMKEGKVVYERTIQFQMRIQGMNGGAPNNPPRSRTDRFELSFAPKHSLWEALPDMEENNEQTNAAPGGAFVLRMAGGADDLSYTNFEKGTSVAQRELASKNYLVEDSIRKLPWKLTGEQKSILGYTVHKATATRIGTRNMMSMENGEMKRQQVPDTTVINAWFTNDIPVPAGPEFAGQLPGLILELEQNNGRVVYKAVEISSKVNVNNIKEPKGGKRISAEDFSKEREKVLEEMRRNMPPGGRIMRIQS